MREIRFRAKRKADGKWVEGNLFIPDIETAETAETETAETEVCIGTPTVRITYAVIPETVGQYTGLTDKNGNKIFEGDIVDILTENEEIGVVAYDDGGFLVNADGFCVDFINNINGTDVEVIGNIHDNPELLEVGE